MDKDDLERIIYEHYNYLKQIIEQYKKDLEYRKDILKVEQKHNHSTYDTEKNIEWLQAKNEIATIIQEEFEDIIRNNGIEIEDIIKECE